MKFLDTPLAGLVVIEPKVFADGRGFFMETYHLDRFRAAGIPDLFVQDNHSSSNGPVLRGLHYQEPNPQGKLVRCLRGAIFDVAVDIRRTSPTFGRWFGIELSEANRKMLWIPTGFAHGFCTLSDGADVLYKCTDFYRPDCERGIIWNDSEIGIEWPIRDPILSTKDAAAPPLADAELPVA